MLELRGASGSYGQIQAVRGIDLVVPDGQGVALLGRNGAGKSTVLKLLAGVVHPSGGHVVLEHASAATHREATIVDAELEVLRRPAAALRRLRARQAQLARRLAVIDGLEARGRTTLAALAVVSDAVPPGSWLTELTLADGRLRLAGIARDDRLIVAFVAGLRATAALRAVDLEEASGAGGEPERTARRFVVAGTLGADA